MPRFTRQESTLGLYHVMQRGVGKQIVFEDKQDHKFYLERLNEYKEELKCELIAYCLLDNHAHLLIRTDSLSDVSGMMLRLGTSYANYYNKKYERSGHVFQGRYLSEPINDERYLLSCVRYIHNNPVKAGITTRERYPWSSYREYTGESILINQNFFLEIIGDMDQFISFSAEKDDTIIMDCDDDVLSEKDALCLIGHELGMDCSNAGIIKSLSKPERDRIILLLKNSGMSVRTIERITGISKRIIYRAGKSFS